MKSPRTILAAMAVAAALGTAGILPAVSQTQTAAPALPSPMSDNAFVELAGSGGLYEVASSTLARDRATDPAIREYAERMIQDHQVGNEELAAAATAAGLTVPADPVGHHAAMLAELEAADGGAFDQLYVRQQIMAHEEAVALYEAEAQSGGNAELVGFAERALPLLREHLDLARALPGGS